MNRTILLTAAAFAAIALPSLVDAQCVWQKQDLLVPGAGYGAEPQYFARSLSLQGTELLVGSPGLEGALGTAQLFDHVGEIWLSAGALEGTGLTPDDDFGRTVSLQGDYAAVGAPVASGGAGRVHIFERTLGVWSEAAILLPPVPGVGNFGGALALHGDTVLVGSPLTERVVIFERGPGGWAQSAILAPDEPTLGFGGALAFDGSRAVVGASGEEKTLVFEKLGSAWVEVGELEAEDEFIEAEYGASVAICGDVIAVGAEGENEPDSEPEPGESSTEDFGGGAVYVFRFDGVQWNQEATIPAPSAEAGTRFGASIAMLDEVLVVGSPGDQGGLGRAFAYYGVSGHWFEAATLTPYLDATQGQFGSAVALSEDVLFANVGLDETGLIGAVGPYAGAAQEWTAHELGCELLMTDRNVISVSEGGAQTMLLGISDGAPAPMYLVLGSASGAYPGSVLGSIAVPLMEDWYFHWTATHPNSGPLESTFGAHVPGTPTLASIGLPPNSPQSLIGLALNHAYVGIDLSSPLVFTYASNPVELTLVP